MNLHRDVLQDAEDICSDDDNSDDDIDDTLVGGFITRLCLSVSTKRLIISTGLHLTSWTYEAL